MMCPPFVGVGREESAPIPAFPQIPKAWNLGEGEVVIWLKTGIFQSNYIFQARPSPNKYDDIEDKFAIKILLSYIVPVGDLGKVGREPYETIVMPVRKACYHCGQNLSHYKRGLYGAN